MDHDDAGESEVRDRRTPAIDERLATDADDIVRALNEDFEKIRNRDAWREHCAETALWDRTSADGLR